MIVTDAPGRPVQSSLWKEISVLEIGVAVCLLILFILSRTFLETIAALYMLVAALLFAALRSLTADQQLALELHYWQGLGAAELAEVFEVEPTTMRTRLHRARARLKAQIEQMTTDPTLRVDALQSLHDPGDAPRPGAPSGS